MQGHKSSMESHVCSGECDSIHKHIISKILLTIRDSRKDYQIKDDINIPIRHVNEERADQTPRKNMNKWVREI